MEKGVYLIISALMGLSTFIVWVYALSEISDRLVPLALLIPQGSLLMSFYIGGCIHEEENNNTKFAILNTVFLIFIIGGITILYIYKG